MPFDRPITTQRVVSGRPGGRRFGTVFTVTDTGRLGGGGSAQSPHEGWRPFPDADFVTLLCSIKALST